MTVKIGDRLPSAQLLTVTDKGPTPFDSAAFFVLLLRCQNCACRSVPVLM